MPNNSLHLTAISLRYIEVGELWSSIRDIVNHPSFKGFGEFILLLDNRSSDGVSKANGYKSKQIGIKYWCTTKEN